MRIFETGIPRQQTGISKDTREYYTDKRRLWIQAYAPDKRSLIEFKDEMLMGPRRIE